MQKKRWMRALCIAALCIALCCAGALAEIGTRPGTYVSDQASILSDEDKAAMHALAERLYLQSGAEVMTVTVERLDDVVISQYAAEMLAAWQIGGANKAGVVWLVSTGDQASCLLAADGLSAFLTTDLAELLVSTYAQQPFATGAYGEGMRAVLEMTCELVASHYGVPLARADN